jgi:rRNA-processing protein FCF1
LKVVSLKTIVLDSSALLAFLQEKIDVIEKTSALLEEPLRFVVLKPCLAELRAVAKPAAFDAIAHYLQKRGVSVADAAQQKPDDAILEFALKNAGCGGGCVVVSLDGGLRKRLKRQGTQTITLRGSKLVRV